jgi:hypothetical protein
LICVYLLELFSFASTIWTGSTTAYNTVSCCWNLTLPILLNFAAEKTNMEFQSYCMQLLSPETLPVRHGKAADSNSSTNISGICMYAIPY